jgi:GNAT superfamily N-acetyltransferase
MENMKEEIIIEEIKTEEIEFAINMVKTVFNEFVGKDYSEEGNKEFLDFLLSDKMKERLKNNLNKTFIAKYDSEIIGLLEIKNNDHISLFFIKKEFHGKGIGRILFEYYLRILKQNNYDIKIVSVNSSIFAENIYSKLGFRKINEIQEKNGIKYLPMEYKV